MKRLIKRLTFENNKKKHSWMILIGVQGVFGLFIGLFLAINISGKTAITSNLADIPQQNDFVGITTIEPPKMMPDFTLTRHTGDPISLGELTGKHTLMFFGYTHCPDVCPLTLNEFRLIREDLNDFGDQVNFVFVSVDGSRDNPEALADYLKTRNVSDFVIGMTGDETEVRAIGVNYNLFFERSQVSSSPANYLVDHSSSSFLLNRDGNWVRKYAFGMDRRLIVEDLQTLINSG